MRLWVDPDRCQGHTLCHLFAPDLVVLSETDGHGTAVDASIPADREQEARRAVAACPEQAISLLDD
jgi:ferredoxin